MGHPPFALLRQQPVVVFAHRHGQRRALVLPVGDQLVEGDRVDHRARQDVRADLAAFLEDADGNVAAGLAASCFRRMAALSPAGPAPTTTTSYCIDSRSLIRSSRRGRTTIQLVCPAHSLTIASMAVRKGVWAGNWKKSALPRRAAHWPGGSRPESTSQSRRIRATGLKPLAPPSVRPAASRVRAECRRTERRRPSPTCNRGLQAAPAFRSRPSPRGGSHPTDRKMPR